MADWFSKYEATQPQVQASDDWFSKYESTPSKAQPLKPVEEPGVGGTFESKDGLITRLGKGIYNAVVAMPAYVLKTKSSAGQLGQITNTMRAQEEDFRNRVDSGEPVTPGEVDWYLSPTNKAGKVIQRPDWAVSLWNKYQAGELPVGEDTKEAKLEKLNQSLDKGKLAWSEKSDIFAQVSQAESFTEKATDVVAGVVGFAARLALLKKAFPDLHPSMLWEVENQVSGGDPGQGALMYAAFAVPGKVIPGKELGPTLKRTGLSSASFSGITAVEGLVNEGEVDLNQVAISAGIPWALNAPSIIKAGLKLRSKPAPKKPKSPSSKPATKPPNPVPTQDGGIVNELIKWSGKAEKISKKEWEPAVKKLRKEQAGGFLSEYRGARKAGKGVAESIREARKGFKGRAVRPDVKPPEFSEAQWESLSVMADNVYHNSPFKLSNLQKAVDDLRFLGKIPTNYEFGLLDKVIGREATMKLYNNLASQRTFGLMDVPKLLRDGLKSMFGYDPQTIRQFSTLSLRHPRIYVSAISANLKAYASKKQADKIATALEASPSWKLAQEKGINLLGNTPWTAAHKSSTRLLQYGDFGEFLSQRKNRILKYWGKWLQASERGANVGANVGLTKLTELAEKHAKKMATRGASQVDIDRFWKERAANINVFSKRLQAKTVAGREVQNAANWVLFSPSYTAARPVGTWRAIKQMVKGGDRTYAAEITAANIAGIMAASSMVSYAAHQLRLKNPGEEPTFDSSTNPMNSMWGKVRVGNQVFDFTGGDAAWYRLMARVGMSAYAYAKDAIGDTATSRVAGEPVREGGEEVLRYLESRETVLLGLGKTMLSGKDWLGRPIPRIHALLQAFPMEFVVDVVEAAGVNGVWEDMMAGDISEASKDMLFSLPVGLAGFMGLGSMSYPVPAVSTRASFRDILAQDQFKKDWTDLTPKQQSLITRENRDEFEALDKLVLKERVDRPVNIDRIKEEERETGEWIRTKLNKQNQTKVESTSLGLSRRPGNFYLNDTRFNRYRELVVEELNKQLSRYNKPKEVTVENILSISKRLAWNKLQREMDE